MTSHQPKQLDLLPIPTEDHVRKKNSLFGMLLDHRSWLRFLVEEWLPSDETGRITLGIDSVIEIALPSEFSKVAVWFDRNRLPALDIEYWDSDGWQRSASPIPNPATAVSWHGPLPLFAVAHFTVESPEIRAHLLAMVRNFADIELPSQPIQVGDVSKILPPTTPPVMQASVMPPPHWDNLRGAASMAMATVPTIGPWLQILCDSLSNHGTDTTVEHAHAPWLETALWSGAKESEAQPNLSLWRSIRTEFAAPKLLNNWMPEELLKNVCARARELGESDEVLDRLSDSTMLLLRDRGTIDAVGMLENTVALVFQLLLLRPAPARFLTWKEDWRAIPPGAWWTGAILSGYLSGYKGLPISMRGSATSRLQVALRTWKMQDHESLSGWNMACSDNLKWTINQGNVLISTSNNLLAEHRLSTRGHWYIADLTDPAARREATELARSLCPENLHQKITILPGEYKTDGISKLKFDSKSSCLVVSKPLTLPVSEGIVVTEDLNTDAFRAWLSEASIDFKLPRPSIPGPSVAISDKQNYLPDASRENLTPLKQKRRVGKCENLVDAPQGLRIHENFIDEPLERSLIATIDRLPWDTTMSRRVQHFGWKYDYKARKVDSSSYLGRLPSWAEDLAGRLVNAGLVAEIPDQVIVNEYRGMQGISKHIDCPTCFIGPVITISLCETWEMAFSKKSDTNAELKYRVMLPRRSATVLDGESRSVWNHEIAKKKTDNGYPRDRRVSITFRKVLIS